MVEAAYGGRELPEEVVVAYGGRELRMAAEAAYGVREDRDDDGKVLSVQVPWLP